MTTCPECGDDADAPLHAECLIRLARRVADLQTAVAVAREERDRADQQAKAQVQAEMAALRRQIMRLKRPRED